VQGMTKMSCSNVLGGLVLLCAVMMAGTAFGQEQNAVEAFEKGNLGEARLGFTADAARGDVVAKNYLAYLDIQREVRAGHAAPEQFGLLKQRADGSDPLAQALLAQLYLAGYGVQFLGDRDGSTARAAVALLESAASAGNAVAQDNLGIVYLKGLTLNGESLVPQDMAQAVKWLTSSASLGNLTAEVNLGEIYASGAGADDKPDYGKALMWLNKAAIRHDARAEAWLARMYEEGHGIARDERVAQDWDARATADDPDKDGTMYAHAFKALRGGDYEVATGEFQHFLQTYPNSEHASDATYWMAEMYYVTTNKREALAVFQSVLAKYPGSNKAPDALFKVAQCERALGQEQQADEALAELLKSYPGSAAATKARSLLKR